MRVGIGFGIIRALVQCMFGVGEAQQKGLLWEYEEEWREIVAEQERAELEEFPEIDLPPYLPPWEEPIEEKKEIA